MSEIAKLDDYYAILMMTCNTGDEEDDHLNADRVIIRILTELGYHKVVDEFNKIEKWYS